MWRREGRAAITHLSSSTSLSFFSLLLFAACTYVVLDLFLNHGAFPLSSSTPSSSAIIIDASVSGNVSSIMGEASIGDPLCADWKGFIESPEAISEDGRDPWGEMKWVGKPARCRVRGHLIESLDAGNNFRRGFAFRFTRDVEDKTHLLPWLLASRIDLNRASPRRVLLDLGAHKLSTSLLWFARMYPCDFTEVHAFEPRPHLLQKPLESNPKPNYAPPNRWSYSLHHMPQIPPWMLDRIHIYPQFIANSDQPANNTIDITRFMKEELRLQAEDVVVVKMDIEGDEWPILQRWVHDPLMATIVDELFIEVHYDHPSMHGYHWARFAPTTREEAAKLLAELRWRGFFVHFWP